MYHNHIITLTGGTTSITSLIIGSVTQSNIAWGVGIGAGLATMLSGYLAWRRHEREKKAAEINNQKLIAETEAAKEEANYFKKQTELLKNENA